MAERAGIGRRIIVGVVVVVAVLAIVLVLFIALPDDTGLGGGERTIEQLPESITPPGVDVDPNQSEGTP